MYPAFGRNRQPREEDYANVSSEWTDMQVEGPYGRGPLKTSYWCNGFKGRFIFHELNTYLCRGLSVQANVAFDFELKRK